MEAFLVSAAAIALAEIGDKSQLLAFLLAARFRRSLPILAGLALATLVNHSIAGAVGAWLASVVDADVLRWLLGAGFLLMAGWMLIPDRPDPDEIQLRSTFGVFGASLVAFFLAEIGDKTQIATVGLTIHFGSPVSVILGAVLGMIAINLPAVLLGDRLAERIPLKIVRGAAAILFALFGVGALIGADAYF